MRRGQIGEEFGLIAPLDHPAHVQQRLVDLSDRPQHVFFEHDRIGLLGVLRVVPGIDPVREILVEDPEPEHGDRRNADHDGGLPSGCFRPSSDCGRVHVTPIVRS